MHRLVFLAAGTALGIAGTYLVRWTAARCRAAPADGSPIILSMHAARPRPRKTGRPPTMADGVNAPVFDDR
jgi:hypothetical protein